MWSRRKSDSVAGADIPGLASIQSLLSDSEALLKATANQGGEKIQDARARFEKSLRSAQEGLAEFEGRSLQRAKHAARATNAYAHEHPWRVVLTGMSLGLVIGLLARNR